ncbi:MAG: transcription factor [Gemmataceae bacterium]
MALLRIDRATFDPQFGRRPFAVGHHLADHPLFRLDRILLLARSLPEDRVEYNAGELPVGIDGSLTPRNGLSIEETVRRIEACRSWMVLKNVERDPEYAALLGACLEEVAATGHPAAQDMVHREAFLFLSSPGSVTPYHIDPEQNFLLQIRGKKFITVFDGEDRSLLTDPELEKFYQGAHRNLVYKDEFGPKGTTFEMDPGDGVHVPVTAPHWVKNGPDVSVSFSITFQNRASERRGIIYRVNGLLRGRGLTPPPVGASPWRDGLKSLGYRVVRRLRRTITGKAEGP